ncbi:MAG: helix-turn-helix domain-containing protein [Thermoanaerobaculia bacterium]
MYHFTGKPGGELVPCFFVVEDQLVALGRQLRAARERKKLSLVQLSAISGVSKNHIAAAEGGANVSVGVLAKLALPLSLSKVELADLTLDLSVPRAEAVSLLLHRALENVREALVELEEPRRLQSSDDDRHERLAALINTLHSELERQSPSRERVRELMQPITEWTIGVREDPWDATFSSSEHPDPNRQQVVEEVPSSFLDGPFDRDTVEAPSRASQGHQQRPRRRSKQR